MVNAIEESFYRWQKDGWTPAKIDNGQFTLVHSRARPVICGSRTQFQTVGAVQGEMQRALREGPKPAPVAPPAAEPSVMPRRPRKKPKPRQTGEQFEFDSPPRATISPRRPALIIREVTPRVPVAFENAAWELYLLRLALLNAEGNTEPGLINVMARRYREDEAFRKQLIDHFRATPQATIQALRQQVAAKA